jgi:hypothetical protein
VFHTPVCRQVDWRIMLAEEDYTCGEIRDQNCRNRLKLRLRNHLPPKLLNNLLLKRQSHFPFHHR